MYTDFTRVCACMYVYVHEVYVCVCIYIYTSVNGVSCVYMCGYIYIYGQGVSMCESICSPVCTQIIHVSACECVYVDLHSHGQCMCEYVYLHILHVVCTYLPICK